METREFQAMGGTVEVQLVDGAPEDLDCVQRLFEQHEQCLSRFLPWSELERMHAKPATPFNASPTLFEVVAAGLHWSRATNGVFDPTVRGALEACGYDRTFREVAGTVGTSTLERQRAAHSWRDVKLDRRSRTITLPGGVRLDLGGIGKGFTVDRAIERLNHENVMINASGDLFASGKGPGGGGWIVGVQDPFDASRDITTIRVYGRGVATSGSTGRSWTRGDTRYHHLIDTRTGHSAESDVATATVVARDATHADVLAKAAYLLGPREGLELVGRYDAAALFVSNSGDVVTTTRWKEYTT